MRIELRNKHSKSVYKAWEVPKADCHILSFDRMSADFYDMRELELFIVVGQRAEVTSSTEEGSSGNQQTESS